MHEARTIDQNVGRPKRLYHVLRERFHGGGRANVKLLAPCASQVCKLFGIEIGRDHLRAFGAERLADGAPDALPGRRHERDFVVETLGHEMQLREETMSVGFKTPA